jgi:hypothetical protein
MLGICKWPGCHQCQAGLLPCPSSKARGLPLPQALCAVNRRPSLSGSRHIDKPTSLESAAPDGNEVRHLRVVPNMRTRTKSGQTLEPVLPGSSAALRRRVLTSGHADRPPLTVAVASSGSAAPCVLGSSAASCCRSRPGLLRAAAWVSCFAHAHSSAIGPAVRSPPRTARLTTRVRCAGRERSSRASRRSRT